MFTTGDYVEVIHAQFYTVAQVTGEEGAYVLARLAKGGTEYTYRQDQLALSTQEAFSKQAGSSVPTGEWWEQAAKEQKPQITHPSTGPASKAAWQCLECGTAYTGKICTTCGSSERIYNTGA